jgi:hypothetical protein
MVPHIGGLLVLLLAGVYRLRLVEIVSRSTLTLRRQRAASPAACGVAISHAIQSAPPQHSGRLRNGLLRN